MHIESRMKVPTAFIRQFQELVKKHNLRFMNFKGNEYPVITKTESYYWITVGCDDPDAYVDFGDDWERIKMPIVIKDEVRKLPLRRKILKFFGDFKWLRMF